MLNTLNNIQEVRRIASNLAGGMNSLAENYNSLISIEERMINIQKDINDIRTRPYLAQNILEKSFEELEFLIMRRKDISPVSSEAKNILKVDLDMPSHTGKSQMLADADNIGIKDASRSSDKNILTGIQEMAIISKDKSLKIHSSNKDKPLLKEDNSHSNDKLLSKGETSDDIIFFRKEKT